MPNTFFSAQPSILKPPRPEDNQDEVHLSFIPDDLKNIKAIATPRADENTKTDKTEENEVSNQNLLKK